jgi:hypothetical protein
MMACPAALALTEVVHTELPDPQFPSLSLFWTPVKVVPLAKVSVKQGIVRRMSKSKRLT